MLSTLYHYYSFFVVCLKILSLDSTTYLGTVTAVFLRCHCSSNISTCAWCDFNSTLLRCYTTVLKLLHDEQEGVPGADAAVRVGPAGWRHLRDGHRPGLLRQRRAERTGGTSGRLSRPGTGIPARLPRRSRLL
jgi:hypothetical protein